MVKSGQKVDKKETSRNDPRFRLLSMILDFRDYCRIYVSNNIPNVNRDLRIHLLEESYLLARSSVSAAHTVGNIRRKHITEMCVEISMLNVLIGEVQFMKTIDPHRLDVLTGRLSRIRDCVYGWKHNEEAKRQ